MEIVLINPPNPWDYELVYARYIRKNGKIIRPKNAKAFRFWVKRKPDSRNNRYTGSPK